MMLSVIIVTATLTVFITAVNNKPPRFLPVTGAQPTASVATSSLPGTSVIRIVAVNPRRYSDSIEYHLVYDSQASTAFEITDANRLTGVVTVARQFVAAAGAATSFSTVVNISVVAVNTAAQNLTNTTVVGVRVVVDPSANASGNASCSAYCSANYNSSYGLPDNASCSAPSNATCSAYCIAVYNSSYGTTPSNVSCSSPVNTSSSGVPSNASSSNIPSNASCSAFCSALYNSSSSFGAAPGNNASRSVPSNTSCSVPSNATCTVPSNASCNAPCNASFCMMYGNSTVNNASCGVVSRLAWSTFSPTAYVSENAGVGTSVAVVHAVGNIGPVKYFISINALGYFYIHNDTVR